MTQPTRIRPVLVIVDDESDVLRSLHDLFRLEYQVETFTRPAAALEYLKDHEAGVVMSDQRMPELTGVEFLRLARKIRPDATLLLFTAYTDIRAVIDAINQGNIFRYITKPWNHEELATIIRQAFEVHDLIVGRRHLVAQLREANAQLEEANQVKTAFIEVASHELNTPVAVVLGLAELWRMQQGPHATDPERAWVDRIHRAGKRLACTVERMLKLVRAEELDHTLDMKPTELEPLVRDVVSELQPFLTARQQRVILRIAPDLGAAEIDAAKIGDVLTNLLANAIKFTADGGTIDLAARSDGPDHVRFSVIDQGVGISLDDRRHLFEPFFTGYDTLHHSSGDFQFCAKGIGLGLHLVKRFVEMHNGEVEVVSEPERGSTFSFTVPRHATVVVPAYAAG